MDTKTVLLTFALAASILVPAAAAQQRGDIGDGPASGTAGTVTEIADSPLVVDDGLLPAAPVDPTLAPVDLQALPVEVPPAAPLVDDVLDVSISVQAQGTTVVAANADSDASEPPSFGERAAAVAVPAAGAGAIVVSLGALAFGLEGLRSAQPRFAGALARLLRGIGALAGGLPLFSRIERGGVLENPVRARVHDAVAQEPGLSLSDVTQRAGIAWGTAVHHLRRLEAHGLVVSVHELAHRRFFIANTPAAAQRAAMAVVMHPTARRIAEYVTQRPGTDQAGLCRALGLNNPAASKHLGHFESKGLVLSERSGRSRLYHPTGGLQSILLLLDPSGATVTPASVKPATAKPAIVTLVAAPRPLLTVGAG